MGIAESLNRHPRIAYGVTGGVIVVALTLTALQLGSGASERMPTRAYFTTDDGKTLFADAVNRLPPFQHDGKEAVRAMVYRGPDGRNVVAFLEKYSPEYVAAVEKFVHAPARGVDGRPVAPGLAAVPRRTFALVKRPDDAAWVPVTSAQGRDIEMGVAKKYTRLVWP